MNQLKVIAIPILIFSLTACPLEGDVGTAGPAGAQGPMGDPGINCWDLNQDGVNDSNEDANSDGEWNASDCTAHQVVTQNPDVELNHQHICEAFANLGQYPTGCPSNIHTPPTGILTLMSEGQFDGSYETCSDLSITQQTFNGETAAYWTLEGGYLGSRQIIELIAPEQCESQCNSDTNCFAAYFQRVVGTNSAECALFYHSDTVSSYIRRCGIEVSGVSPEEICLSGLGTNKWWATCP